MKALPLFLWLSIGSLAAAEEGMTREDAINKLTKHLEDGDASAAQHDAFRELVRQGPEGWEPLFRALCRTDKSGDAARKVDCFWETSLIPEDLVERFQVAKQSEIARRASNESWALLYAGAYVRTEYRARRETHQDRLDRHFSNIGKCLARPADALIEVAFLRVRLLEAQEFPGHRFPWNEKAEKQKVALQGLLDWWKKHRDDFNADEP